MMYIQVQSVQLFRLLRTYYRNPAISTGGAMRIYLLSIVIGLPTATTEQWQLSLPVS